VISLRADRAGARFRGQQCPRHTSQQHHGPADQRRSGGRQGKV